jgi:predicted NUDIX family NTP pyrophosphohydrolase
MPKESAGLLVYRRTAAGIEVLLAHPGGPLWARKDEGAWTIPKGEIEPGEDGLAAARREFAEEAGRPAPEGACLPLSPVRQPGGKIVHAWAVEGDLDPRTLRSNTFEMEWPPRSGRTRDFPEVDRFEYFPLAVARRKILSGQRPLLDELAALIGEDHLPA